MKLILSFFLVFSLSSISFAEEICSQTSGNSALVVIDMQPYFATRNGSDKTPANKAKLKEIQDQQIAAIKRAKLYGIPIIFIEYEHPMVTGETNKELKLAAQSHNEVRVIKKTTDGMFNDRNKYKAELAKYLKQEQIGTLIIAGANGGACVKESITGALNSDCNVIAFSKGIADFNFPDFIYPYVGKYSMIHPTCMNCSFKEISNVENITTYMVNNSGKKGPASVPFRGPEKGKH